MRGNSDLRTGGRQRASLSLSQLGPSLPPQGGESCHPKFKFIRSEPPGPGSPLGVGLGQLYYYGS